MSARQSERLDHIDCAACGTPITYAGKGRRPRYCSSSCRRTGWALEQAQQRLDRGDDPRPEVVRETVTSERVRTINRPDHAPNAPDEWAHQLPQLTRQLADPRSATAHADRDERHRLAARLLAALAELSDTTTGGLDWHQLARQYPGITRTISEATTTRPAPANTPTPAPLVAPSARATPPPGPVDTAPSAGDTTPDTSAGLSRQQRRAAERARRKHRH